MGNNHNKNSGIYFCGMSINGGQNKRRINRSDCSPDSVIRGATYGAFSKQDFQQTRDSINDNELIYYIENPKISKPRMSARARLGSDEKLPM